MSPQRVTPHHAGGPKAAPSNTTHRAEGRAEHHNAPGRRPRRVHSPGSGTFAAVLSWTALRTYDSASISAADTVLAHESLQRVTTAEAELAPRVLLYAPVPLEAFSDFLGRRCSSR